MSYKGFYVSEASISKEYERQKANKFNRIKNNAQGSYVCAINNIGSTMCR
jgi:hypothetical protein